MRVRARTQRGGEAKREVAGGMGLGGREARDCAGKGENPFGSQMDTDGRRWRHEAREARRNGKWLEGWGMGGRGRGEWGEGGGGAGCLSLSLIVTAFVQARVLISPHGGR
jgi:hypothetical protein